MQTATPAPQALPTIGFYAGYRLADGIAPVDLLEDATCLLDSAAALASNTAHHTENAQDQAGMFGIWHLIRLSMDLVKEATATLTKERASCTN